MRSWRVLYVESLNLTRMHLARCLTILFHLLEFDRPPQGALQTGRLQSFRRTSQGEDQSLKLHREKDMTTLLGQLCLALSSLWLLDHVCSFCPFVWSTLCSSFLHVYTATMDWEITFISVAYFSPSFLFTALFQIIRTATSGGMAWELEKEVTYRAVDVLGWILT